MLIKRFFVLLLCGFAVNAAAHRYFFSLTDLSVNEKTQSIEIIHQLSAHDIDNVIAETQQIQFSVGHPDYENYIRQYIEAHFQLYYHGQTLPLNWIGLEISKGYIILYQEAEFHDSLIGLKVMNSFLVDNYGKQINTVNFKDKQRKGSLTFTKSDTMSEIQNSH